MLFRPVISFSLVFLNLVNIIIFTQAVLNCLCHLQLTIWKVKVNVFEHSKILSNKYYSVKFMSKRFHLNAW